MSNNVRIIFGISLFVLISLLSALNPAWDFKKSSSQNYWSSFKCYWFGHSKKSIYPRISGSEWYKCESCGGQVYRPRKNFWNRVHYGTHK